MMLKKSKIGLERVFYSVLMNHSQSKGIGTITLIIM